VGAAEATSDDGAAVVVAWAGVAESVAESGGVRVGVGFGFDEWLVSALDVSTDSDGATVGEGVGVDGVLVGWVDGVGVALLDGFGDGLVDGLLDGFTVGVGGGAAWAVAGTPGAVLAPLCQTKAAYPPSGILSDPAPSDEYDQEPDLPSDHHSPQ
jgi:hypothetical protein